MSKVCTILEINIKERSYSLIEEELFEFEDEKFLELIRKKYMYNSKS
jgi:hypothetical protein